LLIDLPGVQSFGITHLTKEQVGNAFPEIVHHRTSCSFDNCSHLSEEQCGVVKAVESGLLPFSRYESYAKMIAEIDDAKRY
jgi:ribosome biogenesis GTPase